MGRKTVRGVSEPPASPTQVAISGRSPTAWTREGRRETSSAADGPFGGLHHRRRSARQGLIDEYRLVIRPVALGSGAPLFKDLTVPLRFRLIESKDFRDGTGIRVYEPVTSH